jgi:hypothetical protein
VTPKRVLLLHLDGSLPNIALMRIAAHHRMIGDDVELRQAPEKIAKAIPFVARGFWDGHDLVYASSIFKKTAPVVSALRKVRPDAIIGGTGIDNLNTLEAIGIHTLAKDYSDYPAWKSSIGFSQRGCRLKCSFCGVPEKEPILERIQSIKSIWRGEPWLRQIILLDNDFFGVDGWENCIEEMKADNLKVSFCQGLNVRALKDDQAAAVAGVRYYNDSFDHRRLYCAWDNKRDEKILFRGLNYLVKHGVKPDHLMVYVLIGYDHNRKAARPFLTEDDFHRVKELRAFGARPYPMPFVRPRELVKFQTWIVGGYDKRIPWADWEAAHYDPTKLGRANAATPLFDSLAADEG